MSRISLGDPNVGRVLEVVEFKAVARIPKVPHTQAACILQQDDDLIP